MRHSFVAFIVVLVSLSVACVETSSSGSSQKSKPEEELEITFGGFIKNGPENELLNGQCKANATRDTLQCDIHNGLTKWNISETTFQVIRTGDNEDQRHYYRQRTSIAALQTETITFKLGMQLPVDTYIPARGGTMKAVGHWEWLIVGAKGRQVE